MAARHFLIDDDLTSDELAWVLDEAARLKKDRFAARSLAGPKSVAVVFEKHSTRTRVSFETAIAELGGYPVMLDAQTSQLGRGEPIEDTARVLSRYVSAIVIRTFAHERLETLAKHSSVPVVNALTDLAHPCQALADLMTIREHKGTLAGRVLAYVGDGNNVANSLLLAGALAGLHVRVATPAGYEPPRAVVDRASAIAGTTGATVEVMHDVDDACRGADVLYTDVWASMGQEAEAAGRQQAFTGYTVDERLLGVAADDAIVMHCLPAHRGEEIAASVIDGPQSVVFDQAENRLHAQKALLVFLFGRA